jgi:hypothetical protein
MEPNWSKLREIRRDAEEAENRGKLSYEKWKAMLEDGLVAAQHNPDLLDFMVTYARPGWKEKLIQDQEAAAAAAPVPVVETTPAAELEPASAPVAEKAPEPLVEAPPAPSRWPKIKWRNTRW